MRKAINKLIRETLEARAEKSPARKKSILALARELRISPEDDEERMRESLDEIDLAHEFNRIRSEAYETSSMESPGHPEWVDAVDGISPPKELLAKEIDELNKALPNRTIGLTRLTPDEFRARTSDFK